MAAKHHGESFLVTHGRTITDLPGDVTTFSALNQKLLGGLSLRAPRRTAQYVDPTGGEPFLPLVEVDGVWPPTAQT
jgi:hypothetical protein